MFCAGIERDTLSVFRCKMFSLKNVYIDNFHFASLCTWWCVVEPADYHDDLYLHDFEDTPTAQDMLEKQQRALLEQQEDDLRQMKNSRSSKPGKFSFVILHEIIMND